MLVTEYYENATPVVLTSTPTDRHDPHVLCGWHEAGTVTFYAPYHATSFSWATKKYMKTSPTSYFFWGYIYGRVQKILIPSLLYNLSQNFIGEILICHV